MKQAGMFEMEGRMGKIDSNGDPLVKLNEVIEWEMFRPELERIRQKARTSRAGAIEMLFARFDGHLRESGFAARKGQIIDASIVLAPAQRNTRQENAAIR